MILHGNSGCKVELLPEHNIIRKTSTKEYNERLLKQKRKQIQSPLLTPKVLNWGHSAGVFFYDMEYINGPTGAEFILKSDPDSIKWLMETVFSQFNQKSIHNVPAGSFEAKIATLPFADKLRKFDWNHIPETECHGDLSLENMIVRGKDVYYIDLLTGIESFVLDIGKIMMDFRTLWSFRNLSLDMNDRLSIQYAMKTFFDQIPEPIRQYVKQATLYQIARVIPYCEPTMAEYLKAKFEEILQ